MSWGGGVNVTSRQGIDSRRAGAKAEEPVYSFARNDTTCVAVPLQDSILCPDGSRGGGGGPWGGALDSATYCLSPRLTPETSPRGLAR